MFEARVKAITPDLIAAMTALGANEMSTRLATALAPLALHEQTSIGSAMKRVFADTPMAQVVANLTK